MGIFGTPGYLKEGPGVNKNAPQKKRFFLFWELFGRKFWKLISLNLFYCLFWVPALFMSVYSISKEWPFLLTAFLCIVGLFFAGPATAGLTFVLRNYAREEHAFQFSDFMDAFKNNWKASFAVSVLDFLVVLFLSVAIPFYYSNIENGVFYWIPLCLSLFCALMTIFANFYIFLMIVTLDLKFKDLLRNSFILSIVALKTNFLTLFFCALIVIPLILFFPVTLLIIPIFGFSLPGFIICFNSWPKVKQYCIDPYYARLEEEERARMEEEGILPQEEEEEEPLFNDELRIQDNFEE